MVKFRMEDYTMLYFAYGPNMNLKNIAQWCDALKIRHFQIISKNPAVLKNFQLVFDHQVPDYNCGGANIHPREGEIVEGVLYDIPEQDFWIIKKKSGVPGIYEEYDEPVTVYLYDNKPVNRVKLFTVPSNRCQNELKPSRGYMKILIEGAQTERLHPDYIAKLKSLPTMD